MGQAYIAKGTTIGYKQPTSATGYTTVNTNFVTAITPPDYQYGEAETTVLASQVQTTIPTILQSPEFSFTVQHVTDDTTIAFLENEVTGAAGPTIRGWQITYADGSTDAFTGWVKGYAPQAVDEPGAVQEAEVTVKITSLITNVPNSH